MIINISNDQLKSKILKILKESLKNIKLKDIYEISFSIKENKYLLEIIKEKEKTIFRRTGEYSKERGFYNLSYNIEQLKNYIDNNILIKYYLKPRKKNEIQKEEQSDFYGYDINRSSEELLSIYENLSSLLFECEVELESYDYLDLPDIHLYFFGQKVQLKINNEKSDFIYFKKDINYMGLKEILELLDKSLINKRKILKEKKESEKI